VCSGATDKLGAGPSAFPVRLAAGIRHPCIVREEHGRGILVADILRGGRWATTVSFSACAASEACDGLAEVNTRSGAANI
jgi:hypothetical protein